jgi:drug/metabolite transporter (DMT)-like permease
VAYVLGAAVAFGTVSVLARGAYREGAEPTSLFGGRVLLAAVVLTLLALLPQRFASEVRGRGPAACALAGMAFAAAGLAEFEALSRAPAPAVVLLVFVAPVWVALAGWVLWGEKVVRREAGAIALTIAGLALVVQPGGDGVDGLASVLALSASVLGAVFYLFLGRSAGTVRPVRAAAIAAWAATAVMLVIEPSGLLRELLRSETAVHAVAIGLLTAGGLTLLVMALGGTTALATSAVIAVEPIVTAALSWVFLGEGLEAAQLVGATAVLAGVTLLAVFTTRAPPVSGATGRTTLPRPG